MPSSGRAVCGSGRGRPPAGEGAVPAVPGAGRGGAQGGRWLPASAPAPALGPAPVTLGGACPSTRRPQPMAPSRLQLGLRAAYSGLSSVAGFSIFLVWTVVYSQPGTAAMGGLAGTPGRGGALGPGFGRERGGAVSCSRGSLRAALPQGAGGVFIQKHPWQRRPRAAQTLSGCHRDPMPAEPRRHPCCPSVPRGRR